mmetsp:Transcript_56694/g.99152  ORF Transcript_56694/g.99152 Transcript_56694/m.99152 type:complete len:253 (+) Transcript_56694:431-1189(+)
MHHHGPRARFHGLHRQRGSRCHEGGPLVGRVGGCVLPRRCDLDDQTTQHPGNPSCHCLPNSRHHRDLLGPSCHRPCQIYLPFDHPMTPTFHHHCHHYVRCSICPLSDRLPSHPSQNLFCPSLCHHTHNRLHHPHAANRHAHSKVACPLSCHHHLCLCHNYHPSSRRCRSSQSPWSPWSPCQTRSCCNCCPCYSLCDHHRHLSQSSKSCSNPSSCSCPWKSPCPQSCLFPWSSVFPYPSPCRSVFSHSSLERS